MAERILGLGQGLEDEKILDGRGMGKGFGGRGGIPWRELQKQRRGDRIGRWGTHGDKDHDRQHSSWWKQGCGEEAKKRLPG